ncbi:MULTISPECIES: hypothetical protein [Pseudomonas]|uniref:hypothetical protein n=1 Tax=Pseudomonas TaxID=286 RepID=UPI001EFF9F31|nr:MULTISPECIES: hypothetical protein [Pseudomonas]MCG8291569.1 hypothetical protein [Pseudomonas entomophila]
MKTAARASAESTVEALACKHHIDGETDRFSALAKTITLLSGDDIELDRTERMIVSLKKLGVLSKSEALKLELQYLREQSKHTKPRKISA